MALVSPVNNSNNMNGRVHKQLTRSLERILEEAQLSGELKLSGRKLKDFPKAVKSKASTKYNLQDTVFAGWSIYSFLLSMFELRYLLTWSTSKTKRRKAAAKLRKELSLFWDVPRIVRINLDAQPKASSAYSPLPPLFSPSRNDFSPAWFENRPYSVILIKPCQRV